VVIESVATLFSIYRDGHNLARDINFYRRIHNFN
jgi:hypothetical protein